MMSRIIGLEVEYGLIGICADGSAIDDETLGAALFDRIQRRSGHRDIFLENGGRLYLDVGNHPEYATPECIDPLDAITYERAGMTIMHKLVQRTQTKLTEAMGQPVMLHLLRNNVDSHGHSWGYHENYSVDRAGDYRRLVSLLLPFLVTRQLISGTGHLMTTAHGEYRYVISQRAFHIADGLSDETTHHRPFINDRDETHADPSQWRRLHVIGGDTPMHTYQAWLSLAITQLVLDVIESGAVWREFNLANIGRALRTIAQDLTGRQRVDLEGGRAASALDIQWAYCERIGQWIEAGHGNPMNRHVHHEWVQTLNGLEANPMEMADRLDWVLKYQMLLDYKQRHQLSVHDARLALIDMHYHHCDPNIGLFWRAQEKGHTVQCVDDDVIADAMVIPPSNTRASIRGRFITAANQANVPWEAGWAQVKAMGVVYDMMNPFTTHDERVESLIRKFA
ncbi:proteasome accessory factor PafA2 family protein [Stomatohabitans albus]|uniref:proteasome accessory factor PafA2 family protein n=1 Tax=Stomatohabitans albus TaxID=3110766 RepID=UPI00300D6559